MNRAWCGAPLGVAITLVATAIICGIHWAATR